MTYTVDSMLAEQVSAYLARLRADDYLKPVVFDGSVPLLNGQPRNEYVAVYANSGTHSAERLDHRQVQHLVTFTVHCVSLNPGTARILAEHVLAQSLDWRPALAGRKFWRMTHPVSQPVRNEQDVSPNLWFTVDQFDLRSTPARSA